MLSADDIKRWLATVAAARLAVAKVVESAPQIAGVDEYDVKRCGEFLEDAFMAGLEAHGQAILKEHLTGETASVA